MGNFAESHSLPTFKERKAAKLKESRLQYPKWLRADKVVDLIYVDLINGVTKSDVIQKLNEGLYPPQEGKGIGLRTALDYIDAAQQRLRYDYEAKAEEMRADLYTKLMSVYADAVEHNDRYSAIGAIQTLMKLTGVAIEKQQTQVNLKSDGNISISFGFNKEEEQTQTDED